MFVLRVWRSGLSRTVANRVALIRHSGSNPETRVNNQADVTEWLNVPALKANADVPEIGLSGSLGKREHLISAAGSNPAVGVKERRSA